MKTKDNGDTIPVEMYAHVFREHVRNYFNLHPDKLAKDIDDAARRAEVEPIKMVELFEQFLPSLVMKCVADAKKIIQQSEAEKSVSVEPAPPANLN